MTAKSTGPGGMGAGLLAALALLAACGSDLPLPGVDAGPLDGGAVALDGGFSASDGGGSVDGGNPTADGGPVASDGGPTSDGGTTDAGDLIGAGFSGGACQVDGDCAPVGSSCITTVAGGACAVSCTSVCADRSTPYAPVTFCIDRTVYEERLGGALPPSPDPGVCVAKCDFGAFPMSGCRAGLHCERRPRVSDPAVVDEVCVPGPWTIGLTLSEDGATVLGASASGPLAAQPYAALAATRCSGQTTADLPADLFVGFARFLLSAAMPAGWERLCSAPADLPNLHGTVAEASEGNALRVSGTRQQLIDWTGLALYGTKAPSQAGLRGPLWASRVLIRSAPSAYFLYAGGTVDHPYPFDSSRGRHFGVVGEDEWRPLDTALEPDREYRLVKANSPGAYTRQWARSASIAWISELARHYLSRHGIPLGIGDLSLPTGGDITDHTSHERGVDIDVYLLTFDRGSAPTGETTDFSRQELWVSACTQSGSTWSCGYVENGSGEVEDLSGDHLPANRLLETLARYALDNPGATHFVQNDVNVIAPIRAIRDHDPLFIDASNLAASGWPAHRNHAHIRLVAH